MSRHSLGRAIFVFATGGNAKDKGVIVPGDYSLR